MLCSNWLCWKKIGKALVWRLCCQQEWGSKKLQNKRATIKIYGGGGAAWPIGSCILSSQPAAPGSIFRVDRGFIMSIEHIYWLVATTKKNIGSPNFSSIQNFTPSMSRQNFFLELFPLLIQNSVENHFFFWFWKNVSVFENCFGLVGLEKIGLKPEKKFFRGSRQDRKTSQVFVISSFFVLLWFVCLLIIFCRIWLGNEASLSGRQIAAKCELQSHERSKRLQFIQALRPS